MSHREQVGRSIRKMQKSQTLNDSCHDLLEPTRRGVWDTNPSRRRNSGWNQGVPGGGPKARTSLFRGLQTEVCMAGNYESFLLDTEELNRKMYMRKL